MWLWVYLFYLFRLHRNLIVLNSTLTHLWENELLILYIPTCYLSKTLDEFQCCFEWWLLNFSNSFWILSSKFSFSLWFFYWSFSACLLSFIFAFCFIFSRFWQASTQYLSCRSPTAQLVICVKGPLSSLCWSSNILVWWRMTPTKETRGLKSSAGLPGMCVRVSRFSVTRTI